MYSNNLTELLKTFSMKELKEFREFLNSTYFNKRQAVNNLYEIIIKFHPDYESKTFTKQNIFEKLFPGKKYNDSSLRVLTHFLTELAEKFLAVQRFESNEIELSLQLESVLCDRNQNKLFDKSISRAFDSLNKNNIYLEDHFFFKYRLQDQLTYYQFSSNYAYVDKIISKSGWEKVFKDLTVFYLIKSMIMYLNTLNLNYLYKREFNTDAFAALIKKLRPEDYEDIPAVKMFYYMIRLKTDAKHESYYFKLKDILFKTKNSLNKYDLMGGYVQMEFYCMDVISKGNLKFEKELFILYKEEIIEKTYQMNDNTMSPMFFRNVVNSALNLKEFKWAKDFIYHYKPELHKKFRENYFNYCLALYEFNVKNFEYSLELISKIKYDEIYMKLNSKVLHLQLIYELGYEDTLVSALENFRHFLSNNKIIPESKKAPVYNFYKYLSRIILLKDKKNKTELAMLRNNISKENVLMNKKWLLETM